MYGLEEADGAKALVMELVEGSTLAELIAQSPQGLPADEALTIARQIADALAAAHEQGVIHRDLKPANVKIRPDGTVKVLDFGLATYWAPGAGRSGSGASDLPNSPTITSPAMTQAGMILGTAAYMAPEQARGKAVDRRADVWAFGAVLFEMLTGRRAFEGEDVTVTLARVVEREPNLDSIPQAVPAHVRHVVQMCLRKDPNRRMSDIRDVRLALEGEFAAASPIGAPPPSADTARRRWYPVLLAALSAVAAAGLAGAIVAWMRPAPEPPAVVRMTHSLPDERAIRSLSRRTVAVSPDGRQFAYNANGGIYVRALDSLVERLVPGTEEGSILTPAFSPDGQSLAYFVGGEVKRIAVSGGASVRLATTPGTVFGLSWATNGTILLDQPGGVWEVSDNGGDLRQLFSTDGRPTDPQRLPGGDWVLYTLWRAAPEPPQIVAHSSKTNETRVLRTDGDSARYVSSGHLVYANEGVLYAVPLDTDRLEFFGGPRPVVEGVRRTAGSPSIVDFDVSASGTLVYIPGPAKTSNTSFTIAVSDRSGKETSLGIPPGPVEHIRVSPGGSQLALGSNDGREAWVSIYDLNGKSPPLRLTFGGRNRYPLWSPDRQRIAFQSTRDGGEGIFVQRVDGTGEVQALTKPEPGESHIPEDWSQDGHLSFAILKEGEYSLWTVSLDGGAPSPITQLRSTEPFGSVFSPNGRWVAYHLLEPGKQWSSPDAGVFVEPFPSTGSRYQAPRVLRDFQPFWSRDGRELFYVGSTGSGELAAVPVTFASGVTFGTPVTFPFRLTAGRLSGSTRVLDTLASDQFVGLLPGAGEEPAILTGQIRLIVNWFEELNRLAPTR